MLNTEVEKIIKNRGESNLSKEVLVKFTAVAKSKVVSGAEDKY